MYFAFNLVFNFRQFYSICKMPSDKWYIYAYLMDKTIYFTMFNYNYWSMSWRYCHSWQFFYAIVLLCHHTWHSCNNYLIISERLHLWIEAYWFIVDCGIIDISFWNNQCTVCKHPLSLGRNVQFLPLTSDATRYMPYTWQGKKLHVTVFARILLHPNSRFT